MGALATMASALSVTTPASAVTCNGGFGQFTCAEGSSVARFSGFLSRPVEGDAFFHMEIDMTGGQIGAVAEGIDENGNRVLDSIVADKDPTANEFEPVPEADLLGSGDGLIDETADFQHPVDIVQVDLTVI